MNERELDLLIHAALEGDASADEVRALDRLLAFDAGARARFEGAKLFFDTLRRVPAVQAPEGLSARILERMALRPLRPSGLRQLSGSSRVFVGESAEARGSKPGGVNRTERIFRPGRQTGEREMSEQGKGSGSKRNIWIGSGVAAAAVLFGAYYATDLPISPDAASGTIAPAQRFRASQPSAGDVQVGSPTDPQSGQTGQAGDAASTNAGSVNQGNVNQGNANQGNANQGNANQGNANQGNANQGNANQGNANQGNANQGNANQGNANQGNANQGNANQGNANQGNANQGRVNLGNANQGNANQGNANQGNANQGKANQGNANQGNANQGNANQGNANQGKANQGNANQGNANQGRQNQSSGAFGRI